MNAALREGIGLRRMPILYRQRAGWYHEPVPLVRPCH